MPPGEPGPLEYGLCPEVAVRVPRHQFVEHPSCLVDPPVPDHEIRREVERVVRLGMLRVLAANRRYTSTPPALLTFDRVTASRYSARGRSVESVHSSTTGASSSTAAACCRNLRSAFPRTKPARQASGASAPGRRQLLPQPLRLDQGLLVPVPFEQRLGPAEQVLLAGRRVVGGASASRRERHSFASGARACPAQQSRKSRRASPPPSGSSERTLPAKRRARGAASSLERSPGAGSPSSGWTDRTASAPRPAAA